jgi:hypothetical protein
LLFLLLLGLVLLFAYHLFLTLVLILFSAFVSHCATHFHSLFTVLPDATVPSAHGTPDILAHFLAGE